MKKLVVYFSASGITRDYSRKLAKKLEADLYEIEPIEPYTTKDLNWMNPLSKSSVEMRNKSSRPEIKNKLDSINDYDKIYIGFPVWWYTCPHIVNTFIESFDFNGKDVHMFFTSGSTKEETIKKAIDKMYPFIKSYKRINSDEDVENYNEN